MATSKVCSSCKIEKPLTDFSLSKARYRDGRRGQCKACRVEYQRRYQQTPAGKAIMKEAERRYDRTPAGRTQRRKAALRYNYGISVEDYNRLLAAQNKMCAICDKPSRLLVVDHCHRTGVIRGLLCQKCNTFLGRQGDTYQSFYRVTEYLAGFERRNPKPCGRRVSRMLTPSSALRSGG